MKNRNLLERLTDAADLSNEPLPMVPLVEIAGEHRLLIENHQGVILYGCQEICVKLCYGHISVRGRGLELARMSKEQLVITGLIDQLSIYRGRG